MKSAPKPTPLPMFSFCSGEGGREVGREGGRHDCIIMPKSAVFGVCANLNASPAGVAEVKQPAPGENMISYEREIDADQRDGPRLRGIRAS